MPADTVATIHAELSWRQKSVYLCLFGGQNPDGWKEILEKFVPLIAEANGGSIYNSVVFLDPYGYFLRFTCIRDPGNNQDEKDRHVYQQLCELLSLDRVILS